MDERLARLKLLTLEEAQAVYFYVRDGRSLNANRAAEIMGVSRNTFYRRWDSARQKLNIPDKGYEPGHYLIYAKYLAKWPSNINWLDDFIASETNETVTQASSTPSETVGTTIPAQESQSPDKPVGKGGSMLNIDTLRVRIRQIAQIALALVVAAGLIYLISTLITRESQTTALETPVTSEETVGVTPIGPVVLWESHFEDGILPRDDEWDVETKGVKPVIVNGYFLVPAEFRFNLGNGTWTDISVTIDFAEYVCNPGIGLRTELVLGGCRDRGDVWAYDTRALVPDTVFEWPGKDEFTFEVKGDRYYYFNNELIYPGNKSGVVWIRIPKDTKVRKIIVTQLP